MSKLVSKEESSPVIVKSEPCNDDVQYINDKVKVEKEIPGEAETEIDWEYTKEDIKEEFLMEIKQEEIIIKDEIPSSSDTQTDLTDDNVVLVEHIELSPTSLNTETSIGTEEKWFASTFCRYKTSKKWVLKQHIDRHARAKPTSNVKFQCAECEYKTLRKGDLVRHIVIHTGEGKFACNLCDFKTAVKVSLKNHMMKHTGEKPFACNLCDFKTAHKFSLNHHIMMKHTGEKPFTCNLCEFKTVYKNCLNRHMMNKHTEKPFACNLCKFKTAQKSNLMSHVIKHKVKKALAYSLCNNNNKVY